MVETTTLKPTTQAFNNHVLAQFHDLIYKDVLTEDHISGSEISIKNIDICQERTSGYALKKDLKTFFIRSPDLCKLPIRVARDSTGKTIGTFEAVHNSAVYHVINQVNTVKIPSVDGISFRDMIDWLCNFNHTNGLHFTLWKVICVAAYCSRVNFRLATPPAFGKDSVIDALRDLTSNCVRIDNATFAKLEYVLRFPFIVCNEVAGLKDTDKKEFESFGLSAGAFQNTYVKRSRKVAGTKEIYNISKLSLGFTYNNAEFYKRIGQKSFDDSFPEQFLNRFLPICLNGVIDVSQFKKEGELDFTKECELNMEVYKSIIQKLNFIIHTPLEEKFHVEYEFTKKHGRWEKSFKTICLYLSHYAQDFDEYVKLTNELYKCHLAYLESETNKDVKTIIADEEAVI